MQTSTLHIVFILYICSTLTSPTLTQLDGEQVDVCPPCPAPPVHACCKADVQVLGACCQVTKTLFRHIQGRLLTKHVVSVKI